MQKLDDATLAFLGVLRIMQISAAITGKSIFSDISMTRHDITTEFVSIPMFSWSGNTKETLKMT